MTESRPAAAQPAQCAGGPLDGEPKDPAEYGPSFAYRTGVYRLRLSTRWPGLYLYEWTPE